MLAEMSPSELATWKAFEQLDPFPSDRADWNAAQIVQALLRNGRPLHDFVLKFGDDPRQTVKQTPEYMERLLLSWCGANNAIQKERRGN